MFNEWSCGSQERDIKSSLKNRNWINWRFLWDGVTAILSTLFDNLYIPCGGWSDSTVCFWLLYLHTVWELIRYHGMFLAAVSTYRVGADQIPQYVSGCCIYIPCGGWSDTMVCFWLLYLHTVWGLIRYHGMFLAAVSTYRVGADQIPRYVSGCCIYIPCGGWSDTTVCFWLLYLHTVWGLIRYHGMFLAAVSTYRVGADQIPWYASGCCIYIPCGSWSDTMVCFWLLYLHTVWELIRYHGMFLAAVSTYRVGADQIPQYVSGCCIYIPCGSWSDTMVCFWLLYLHTVWWLIRYHGMFLAAVSTYRVGADRIPWYVSGCCIYIPCGGWSVTMVCFWLLYLHTVWGLIRYHSMFLAAVSTYRVGADQIPWYVSGCWSDTTVCSLLLPTFLAFKIKCPVTDQTPHSMLCVY